MTVQFQTWYADALRAWGVTVHETPGWQTRTYTPGGDRPAPAFDPEAILVHHTGTPRPADQGNAVPTLHVAVQGRSDLPGPLYAILIGWDACAYLVAAGRTNHGGEGGPLDGITSANRQMIGIALEGAGGDYTDEMLLCAQRVSAALLHRLGQPYGRCWAHREWTHRKPDITVDMTAFRWAVTAETDRRPTTTTTTTPTEDPMVYGLHHFGEGVDTIDRLYQHHRGAYPERGERKYWAGELLAKLRAGADPGPVYATLDAALAGE